MSQHGDTCTATMTLRDESFPKRWKLLITVIDCSHMPRLNNPPRSIHALKARLSAAVGIESTGVGLSGTEATAQAIITGLEGPERRKLENDEDLCMFWENVASGQSAFAPVLQRTNGNLAKDRVQGYAHQSRPSLFHKRSGSDVAHSPSSTRTTQDGSLGTTLLRPSSASASPTSPTLQARESTTDLAVLEEEEEGVVEEDYNDGSEEVDDENGQASRMEPEIDLDYQLKLAAAEEKVEEFAAELDMLKVRNSDLEQQLSDVQDRCNTLQEENLEFIRAFEQQVEARRLEIVADLEKKFSGSILEQGRMIAEKDSQISHLKGQLQSREDKIKSLDATIREHGIETERLLGSFDEERSKYEEERQRLGRKVARVRQLEFFADCWRRKVRELMDSRGKELDEAALHFRVGSITAKLEDFEKGRLVQSPEFDVTDLGKVQIEFFPTGDVNSKEGWCSFRLRVPHDTRVRWRAFIGSKVLGPRTDSYNKKQWWCRYGIVWLNFCTINDVRAEISPETDTLVCGIEVLDVLPLPPENDQLEELGAPSPQMETRRRIDYPPSKGHVEAPGPLVTGDTGGSQIMRVPSLPSSPTKVASDLSSSMPRIGLPSMGSSANVASPTRKLTRPQSVPSTAWKRSQRNR